MNDSNEIGSFSYLFVIAFIISIIICIGVAYKGLRFIANYEIDTRKIVDCNKKLKRGSKESPSFFVFKIKVEGIDYRIREIGYIKQTKFKEIFKKAKPEFDWCSFMDSSVVVYHYDKVRLAKVYRTNPENISKFKLFVNLDMGYGILGFIVLPVFFIIILVYSIKYLSNTIKTIFSKISYPSEMPVNILSRGLIYFNRLLAPVVSIILTIILSVLLGLILIKGMLFIEGSPSFITGILLIIGVFILFFGPGLIIKGVHYLKTSKNEYVLGIKYIIALSAITKLVISWKDFFLNSNFKEFNDETIYVYLIQLIKALF